MNFKNGRFWSYNRSPITRNRSLISDPNAGVLPEAKVRSGFNWRVKAWNPRFRIVLVFSEEPGLRGSEGKCWQKSGDTIFTRMLPSTVLRVPDLEKSGNSKICLPLPGLRATYRSEFSGSFMSDKTRGQISSVLPIDVKPPQTRSCGFSRVRSYNPLGKRKEPLFWGFDLWDENPKIQGYLANQRVRRICILRKPLFIGAKIE